ncbi:hypothetical protein COY32_01100, partial [candidate division WWE3 bacterium CG_4_10_14_0_2_um_filter_41_14]
GQTGKWNASLNFDGTDDYVQTSGGPSLTNQTQVSVSAWIYDNGLTGTYNFIANGQDNNFQFWWNSTYGLCFQVRTTVWNACTGGVVPSVGQWVHVAATYDGNTVRNYIDGRLQNSVAQTGTISTISTGPVTIGNYLVPTSGYEFNGQIDDVRIYNYALTANQIKTVMNEGAAVRF